MPNTPFDDRRNDRRRPPRYDRLQELAAFRFGFEPHRLWFAFIFDELPTPHLECEKWLRDAPVLLGEHFTNYDTERYTSWLDECLKQFEELGKKIYELPDETAEDRKSGPKKLVASDRQWYAFMQLRHGADAPAFGLIRIVKAIGERFPEHLRVWFRLGAVSGNCLYYLTPKYFDPQNDLGQELRVAASRADFTAAEFVPDISIDAYGKRVEATPWHIDRRFVDWARDKIFEFAEAMQGYLEDDPISGFDVATGSLWFLGSLVHLSKTESALLAAIARAGEEGVSRPTILKDVFSNEHDADTGKCDRHLQNIIDQITGALQQVNSPHFRGDKRQTTEWLRAEFVVSIAGFGWRKGPLLAQTVLSDPSR